MPTLEGTLERVTFRSEADGYTIGRVMPRDKTYSKADGLITPNTASSS